MISEYNEKHIKLTPDKISNINKLLFDLGYESPDDVYALSTKY